MVFCPAGDWTSNPLSRAAPPIVQTKTFKSSKFLEKNVATDGFDSKELCIRKIFNCLQLYLQVPFWFIIYHNAVLHLALAGNAIFILSLFIGYTLKAVHQICSSTPVATCGWGVAHTSCDPSHPWNHSTGINPPFSQGSLITGHLFINFGLIRIMTALLLACTALYCIFCIALKLSFKKVSRFYSYIVS